ncbi:MAG: hypothetical protein QXY40_00520 [Candidatus Methanomethylicia archaeon]
MRSKASEFGKLIFEALNTYNSIDSIIRETHRNIKYLGEITGRNSISDKFIKAGVFCMAGIPEPVMSNIIGATLIATGAYIRRKEINLGELPKTLSKHNIELEKIRKTLHELKV